MIIATSLSEKLTPMDVDDKANGASSNVNGHTNGVSKRKSRTSAGQKKSYVEPESSEADEPLVGGLSTSF